jgi:hypothetical protein
VFQYSVKTTRRKIEGQRRPDIYKPQEVLTGELQGKTVPKDEERFYIGMMKTGRVRGYFVQLDIGRPGIPGYRTLDALVNTDFGWRAFEVDGVGFVHKGDRKRAEDKLADIQRVDGLKAMGVSLKNGIEHVPDTKLQTQDDADRTARNLI